MSRQQLDTKNRNKHAKDPLAGAPGHAASVEPTEHHHLHSANADENDATEEGGTVDGILSRLEGLFGQESVGKLKAALISNSRDAEETVTQFIREATANLPKDFKLPAMKNAVKNHPVASASAIAAGLGTVFVLREFFKRDAPEGTSQAKTKAPSRPKAQRSIKASGKSKGGKAGKSAKTKSSKTRSVKKTAKAKKRA